MLDGGRLRYDVGSGVVLDSEAGDEYRECLLKASLLDARPEAAIETLRYAPGEGFTRAARHLARLRAVRPEASMRSALGDAMPDTTSRVRVAVTEDGEARGSYVPLLPLAEPVPVALSRYALTDAVQRTAFKTSRRDFYDGERARVGALCGAAEVLFAGEDCLMREGSFTSLFVQKGRRLLTPRGPGLLPGVLRAELLDNGVATEAELTWGDVLEADAVLVGNSLRGLMRAKVITEHPV